MKKSRFFSFLFALGCFCGFLYQSAKVIDSYFRYETITQLTVSVPDRLSLPEIRSLEVNVHFSCLTVTLQRLLPIPGRDRHRSLLQGQEGEIGKSLEFDAAGSNRSDVDHRRDIRVHAADDRHHRNLHLPQCRHLPLRSTLVFDL